MPQTFKANRKKENPAFMKMKNMVEKIATKLCKYLLITFRKLH